MSALGGRWVTPPADQDDTGGHACRRPYLFRGLSRVGHVWECDCGRQWQIGRTEGFKTLCWVEVTERVPDRRALLDRLAADLVPHLEGEELVAWRLSTHHVLVKLEHYRQGRWARTGD